MVQNLCSKLFDQFYPQREYKLNQTVFELKLNVCLNTVYYECYLSIFNTCFCVAYCMLFCMFIFKIHQYAIQRNLPLMDFVLYQRRKQIKKSITTSSVYGRLTLVLTSS